MGRPPGSKNTLRPQFAEAPDARLQPAVEQTPPTVAEELLAQLARQGGTGEQPIEQTAPTGDEPDWQAMSEAPQDGRALWFDNPEGEPRQGYWRTSRKFLNGVWTNHSYWARWRTGEWLGFEPTGWHPVEGL